MQSQGTSSRDKADAALARILDLFESDALPAAIARSTIARLDSDAPSASWSLGNRLLMFLNGTDDARGFRQWEAAGRKVRKGERAFHILAPCTRKIIETDETGNERERVIVVGFKGIPVFAIESTDGAPVTRPDYTPAEMPPLFEVAGRLGVTVCWLPFSDRYYGYYCPGRSEIVLCSTDWSTFFHELAHRADEVATGSLKPGQDAAQEVVAEVVAATLAAMYDQDLGAIAAAREYVAHYARKGEGAGKAALRAIARVQAALEVILGAVPATATPEAPAFAEAA